MSKTRLVMNVIGSALLLGAMSRISQAQGTSGRAFISTTGTDAGTCTVAAPCRTIAFALTQLADNGELVFLNSGGYGPATITQGVTLSAEGVHASISAPTGSGLTINAPSQTVTVRGLTILGGGSSVDGITVTGVGTLYVQDLTIQDFGNNAIEMMGGNLFLQDSNMRNCAQDGLRVEGSGTTAYVDNSNFTGNSFGVEADDGTVVTVADSTASFSDVGFVAGGLSVATSLSLTNDRTVGNNFGVIANGAFAVVTLDHVLVTKNATGLQIEAGATVTGTNPGTSLIVGNTTPVGGGGTTGTATVLQ
jgi:hypothetical protein